MPRPSRRQSTASPHTDLCQMMFTEDVRKYAAEQGVTEDEALAKAMAEKFVEKGAEVYAKA